MRRIFTGLVIAAMAVTSVGCSYSAIAAHDGKLYIAKNNSFLFGLLNKVYECTPASGALTCTDMAGKP